MEGWRKEWWCGEKAKEKKKQREGRKAKVLGGSLEGSDGRSIRAGARGRGGPLEAEV